MNGKFLLDSNIIIEIFRGNEKFANRIQELGSIIIPVISLGELYFGANKSNQKEKRRKQIEEFENTFEIANVTSNTSKIYGNIKNKLKEAGRPIPENDIWIAAIAKERKYTLISNDKHFKQVSEIELISLKK